MLLICNKGMDNLCLADIILFILIPNYFDFSVAKLTEEVLSLQLKKFQVRCTSSLFIIFLLLLVNWIFTPDFFLENNCVKLLRLLLCIATSHYSTWT